MTGAKVDLELTAEVAKARRDLEKFTSQTQKQLDSISFSSAVSAISAGFDLASKAAQYAGQVFEATVGEAIKFEVATQRLAQSLKNAGDFTQQATEELIAYADSLEAATGVQDDLIISALSLSKSYGLSNDEAKKATAAALELAAATGTSLDSAISQVAGTVSGKYSKELVKLVPELKALTKEQLIAGDAFRLIQLRLNGAALAAGSTTQGEFNKLKNEIADFGKSLGVSFLGPIAFATQELTKLVNTIANFRSLVKAEVDLSRLFKVQSGIGSSGVGNLQAAEGARAAEEARRSAEEKALEGTRIRAEKEKEFREKATTEYEAIRIELSKNGYTALEKLEIDFVGKKSTIENARQIGLIKSERERLQLVANLEKEFAQQSLELRIKNNQKFAQNAGEELTKALLEARRLSSEEVASAGVGALGSSLKGAAGAGGLISSAGGAAANSVLPGSGGAAKEIIDTLSKGPDEVKKMVQSFVEAIPTILSNILRAVPAIIPAFIKAIPALIKGIIAAIPEIISAFIQQIPSIFTALIQAVPQIAVTFLTSLISGIPQMIEGFAREFLKIPGQFVDALLESLGGFFGGGDGGGFLSGIPIIGDVLDFIGLAQGGRVPNDPRFEGDRFPARLNAGEQVLDKDLSTSLERFLNGNGGGGGPTQITIQVGQRELANVILDLNNRGFRTA